MNVSEIGDINTSDLNRAVAYYYMNKSDILLFHVANSDGVYKTTNECRSNSEQKISTSYYSTTISNEHHGDCRCHSAKFPYQ